MIERVTCVIKERRIVNLAVRYFFCKSIDHIGR